MEALRIFSERNIAERRHSDDNIPTRAYKVAFPELCVCVCVCREEDEKSLKNLPDQTKIYKLTWTDFFLYHLTWLNPIGKWNVSWLVCPKELKTTQLYLFHIYLLSQIRFVQLLTRFFPSNLEVNFTSGLSWPARNISTELYLQLWIT